jgi:hypothetical protein
MAKLASKNQPEAKRNEASVAVTLYFKTADTGKANALSKRKSESDRVCSREPNQPESRRSRRRVKRREIMARLHHLLLWAHRPIDPQTISERLRLG